MKHTENELADKRHECQTFSELLIWGINAEEMLRQQKEKLDQYEKSTDYWMKLCQEANAENESLKERVAFLEDKAIMVEPLDDSHYPFRAILRKAQEK